MAYDYSELSKLIEKEFGTRKAFAKAMNVSTGSISCKMSGSVGWRQAEIIKACDLLGIDKDQMALYFFALKVQ